MTPSHNNHPILPSYSSPPSLYWQHPPTLPSYSTPPPFSLLTTGLIDAAAAMAHCSLDRIKLFDAMIEGLEGTTAATSSGTSAAASAGSSASASGINNDVPEPLMTKLLQESDRPAVLNYLSAVPPAQRLVCLTALR